MQEQVAILCSTDRESANMQLLSLGCEGKDCRTLESEEDRH